MMENIDTVNTVRSRLLLGNNMEEQSGLSYMARGPMARANVTADRMIMEGKVSTLINATLQCGVRAAQHQAWRFILQSLPWGCT